MVTYRDSVRGKKRLGWSYSSHHIVCMCIIVRKSEISLSNELVMRVILGPPHYYTHKSYYSPIPILSSLHFTPSLYMWPSQSTRFFILLHVSFHFLIPYASAYYVAMVTVVVKLFMQGSSKPIKSTRAAC